MRAIYITVMNQKCESAKVYASAGLFVVKLYSYNNLQGVPKCIADYETNDREDAIGTAHAMIQ